MTNHTITIESGSLIIDARDIGDDNPNFGATLTYVADASNDERNELEPSKQWPPLALHSEEPLQVLWDEECFIWNYHYSSCHESKYVRYYRPDVEKVIVTVKVRGVTYHAPGIAFYGIIEGLAVELSPTILKHILNRSEYEPRTLKML